MTSTPRGGPSFDDLVDRTRGVQPWRRVFHAANGLILALAPGFLGLGPRATALLLALGTLVLLVGDLARLRVPALNRLFFVAFARLASPREARSVASSTWFVLGAALVWAGTPGVPAVGALLVLALADPAASVVVRTWGGRPLGKGTWVGSTTFAAVAVAALATVVGLPAALAAAAVATAVEVAPLGLDDNLTVPLATAAVLQAWPGVA